MSEDYGKDRLTRAANVCERHGVEQTEETIAALVALPESLLAALEATSSPTSTRSTPCR